MKQAQETYRQHSLSAADAKKMMAEQLEYGIGDCPNRRQRLARAAALRRAD